jgi:hypothetical protein
MCRLANINIFQKFVMKQLAIFFIVIAILNCSTHVVQIETQDVNKCFPYIQLGVTEKQEIFDRFGNPLNSYEGGRIVTYPVLDDIKGIKIKNKEEVLHCEKEIAEGSDIVAYRLVLVFGPNNVIERMSLVRFR